MNAPVIFAVFPLFPSLAGLGPWAFSPRTGSVGIPRLPSAPQTKAWMRRIKVRAKNDFESIFMRVFTPVIASARKTSPDGAPHPTFPRCLRTAWRGRVTGGKEGRGGRSKGCPSVSGRRVGDVGGGSCF